MSSALFAQVKIDNDNYKFHIEYSKGWKAGSKIETDKKDVINYSFSKTDNKMTSSIIAFKFTVTTNLDDFIYKLEKDFNLNIPEKIGGYTTLNTDVYDGKSAEYRDKDSYEKIFYYSTTKDSSGNYFCYMIRFIGDPKLKLDDFNYEVTSIANTFKINI